MRNRAIVFLAAGVLLVPAVPAAAATATGAIMFGACADATLVAGGAECGTLGVPLDPANPGGASITLAVSRVRHTVPDSEYQGVVLVTPDPLSGAGLTNSLLGAKLSLGIGGRYDWVSYAARGVAPSVPAISCVPNYIDFNRPAYGPNSPITEAQWRTKTKGYADACAANQPALLAHMRTTDTAADLDRVRAAVGADRVTLFGQSYGTYNAEIYATLHPERVSRLILDSPVDPDRVWYHAANLDQNAPLQRNLGLWFDWLAQHNDVFHVGATRAAVTAVWNTQLAAVRRNPINGRIGYSEFIDVFLLSPYFQAIWPTLGSAFSGWVNRGDGATLEGLFDAFYRHGSDNVYGALLAQVCTDAPWPTTFAAWRADSLRSQVAAPDTTWGNTWFNAPCASWHVPAGAPVHFDGSKLPSALIVADQLDAATPFAGALTVRDRTPKASLIEMRNNINHGAAFLGNDCVDLGIAAYLDSGLTPGRHPGRGADQICEVDPDPAPLG